MIIDPGLYSLNKSEIWWIIKQRNLPTSFKLYTGFYFISLQSLSLSYLYYLHLVEFKLDTLKRAPSHAPNLYQLCQKSTLF